MLDGLAQRAESLARRAVELVPFPQPPLVRLRRPVVLMHGFGALANLMQGGVLHAEAMHLRGRGVLAYAPHVNPYDTTTVRAASWAARLDHVLAETGADAAHLVAFSSAGLDARHLISGMGLAHRVATLTTVSTPHRGSALADFLLDRPERQRQLAVALMNFIGRAAFEEAPPHAEEALRELTPRWVCETFNPAHPDDPRVAYFSWTGEAGRGTPNGMYPPLVLPNRILFDLAGPNDGLVPVESGRWGTFCGTLPADHARQIGMRLGGGGWDARAFYVRVAEDLAAWERAADAA